MKRDVSDAALGRAIGRSELAVVVGGLGGLVLGLVAILHGGAAVMLAGGIVIIVAVVGTALALTWLLQLRLVLGHRTPAPSGGPDGR